VSRKSLTTYGASCRLFRTALDKHGRGGTEAAESLLSPTIISGERSKFLIKRVKCTRVHTHTHTHARVPILRTEVNKRVSRVSNGVPRCPRSRFYSYRAPSFWPCQCNGLRATLSRPRRRRISDDRRERVHLRNCRGSRDTFPGAEM